MNTDVGAPVIAEVEVPAEPETAFALYVDRPGRTHPQEGLSGAPVAIVYEPFVGGRWFERCQDGSQHDWGRVLEWDPPHRLVLAWMVGVRDGAWAYDPDPARASRVELTFRAIGDGRTRVRVVHTGFEAHAAGGPSIRNGVRGGWREDLADLRRCCQPAPPGAHHPHTKEHEDGTS